MNVLVEEWVKKAEGDRQTANREVKVIDSPNWDAVCFHAQQSVEKYLKALMQRESVPFTRTHDLSQLLRALVPKFPDLEAQSDNMEWLTTFAVEIRYPGESATEDDAKQAVTIMESIITLIHSNLE